MADAGNSRTSIVPFFAVLAQEFKLQGHGIERISNLMSHTANQAAEPRQPAGIIDNGFQFLHRLQVAHHDQDPGGLRPLTQSEN